MPITLVLPDSVVSELEAKAKLSIETAGVLLAALHHTGEGTTRLLARSLHWTPESAYERRTADEMLIAPEGYVEALALAEQDGSVPLWVHTHPNGWPMRSAKDERVDELIAEVFRLRSGSPYYGTVIVSPAPEGLSLTGTVQEAGCDAKDIDRFWMVGDRWRMQPAYGTAQDSLSRAVFNRNIRAFGEPVQRMIGMLQIGVVGCGGTGSAVAEQLVRLGARHLLLVDADTLSASNVTRVYGSTPADVGKPKTEVLADHLRRVAPDLDCETVAGRCTSQRVAESLAGTDLIFGCTDDNAGRLVLSRLCYWFLTPVIDMGVLLTSNPRNTLEAPQCRSLAAPPLGPAPPPSREQPPRSLRSHDGCSIEGIDGRITVLTPGSACLLCRGRVDLARAAAETRASEEQDRLEAEGYAPALGAVEPAVVTFTTMTAAIAVSELLERLVGYGGSPRPSEILLRAHDREISTNIATPAPGHYCHPLAGKLGRGRTEPFLEQVWSA